MTDLNPFERYADAVERRVSSAGGRRTRHTSRDGGSGSSLLRAPPAKRRELKRIKKAMIEQHQLEKQYREQASEGYRELLASDYGHEIQHLVDFLDRMTLKDGAELVGFIQSCIWLISAPADIRHQALRLIGRACVRLREAAGFLPYDDGLPWEPSPAFIRVRELLEGS